MKHKWLYLVGVAAICSFLTCCKSYVSETKVIGDTNTVIDMSKLSDEVYSAEMDDDMAAETLTGWVENNGILVCEYVFYQDKSDKYGVNSTSSSDIYKFLNDDGTLNEDSLGETREVGNYDFSGRFAYPEIKLNGLLKNLKLEYMSDNHNSYEYYDDGEYQGVIKMFPGNDEYMFQFVPTTGLEGIIDAVEFGTLKASDGNDVLVMVEDNTEKNYYSVYWYPLGGFSIEIMRSNNDELYTVDQLQEIMNEIVLK